MSSSPVSQRTDPLGLIGQTLDERYAILELVDEGGYGYVYKAHRVMWDKPVAVKFFKHKSTDPEKRARATKAFIAEGAVLAELSRKTTAIVQSFDIGTLDRGPDGELLYMALEWLEGSTLHALMQDERSGAKGDAPWPLERVIDTLQPVAVALAVAHGSGVAHRDIKPANIFIVDESGSAEATTKLLDFGVAKVVEDLAEGFEHTGHQEGPFTPKYAAPEQFAKRHGSTGPWSDVYALAMVGVELLVGRYPHGSEGFGSLIFAVCDAATRPTPRALGFELTDELEAVFAKALCVKSDERYRDAGAFWRALLEAAGISASTFPIAFGGRSDAMRTVPAIVRSEAPPSSMVPPAKKPWWLLGVVGAALVGTLAGGTLLLRSQKDDMAPATPSLVTTASPIASQVPQERLASYGMLPEAITSPDNPLTEAKVALGRMLFYDKRLSRDGTVACNSCHLLAKHGVDGKRVSTGTESQAGHRNSPTVYNAAGAFALMWDGRASSIEAQAALHLENPKEHGLDDKQVVERLEAIDGYETAFAAAFPADATAITFENVGRALGAFQRKLVTPSRWDAFLEGKSDALTDEERRGFNTFFSVGCPTCHMGSFVGMTMFQKLGLMHAWPASADRGRFDHTQQPTDMMMFRVPSLRNVMDTGPFFHDGSVASLNEAVRLMAFHQLGKELSPEDVKAIVAWLATLSGQIPADYIAEPVLP